MTTFALPARRGDFLYSSVFYADPGNGNHHARASVAELAALLRPEAPNLYTKSRKPEVATPAKDPMWHFYSAQLLHYGLPFTKEKNAAKVRLLNAMNAIQLEVPAWVLKLEGELKNEWEAENRKLRKGGSARDSKVAKSDVARGQDIGGPQGVIGGVNVTVNFTLSSGQSMAEYTGSQHASSNTPKKPLPAKRKRADSNVSSPTATPRKAARIKKEPVPKKTPIKKEPATKRASASVKQEYHSSPAASTPSHSRFKQKQSYDDPYASSYIKPDPSTSSYQLQPTLLISGNYAIDCQTASDFFKDYDLDLTLSLDSSRDVWWATFRWGAWNGIIQMNPGPSTSDTLGQSCSLGWRLRDLDTGKLTFGRRCTGSMTFDGDNTFQGFLYEVPGVGKVEYSGRRMAGGSLENNLQHEWDGFVAEAYRR